MESESDGRLVCRTQSPPLRWLRTRKPAEPSTSDRFTEGVMFQRPGEKPGRLNDVFQRTSVSKAREKMRTELSPGVAP